MTVRGQAISSTWTYRPEVERTGSQIIDYTVEATDGEIGTVTEESTRVGAAYIVVDTGFWIFDKLRLIPAGAIRSIDHSNETIQLDLDTSQVRAAPDYVAEPALRDPRRSEHGTALEKYFIPWV